MIPWIELLFYIGVVFAPENVIQIDYTVENKVYTYNKNVETAMWYPTEDKNQQWSVSDDSVIIKKNGYSTPYSFSINATLARQYFSRGEIYVIDKGFTLKKGSSSIILNFDLGISIENFTVNWIIPKP